MPPKIELKKGVEPLLQKTYYTIYSKWVKPDNTIPNGAYVAFTFNNEIIAYGFYEKIGAIGARILAYKRETDLQDLEDIIEWRLIKAWKTRVFSGENNKEGYRLLYADSDGTPGLIADVFNDTTVLQSTSIGWDKNITIIAEKITQLGITERVYLKNEQRARKQLGLPLEKRFLIGHPPPYTMITEGKARFKVDFEKGHKTGFYLDQRPARERIRKMKLDGYHVLELFSYTGAFSVHALLSGAEHSLLVEENKEAVLLATENMKLNNLVGKFDIIRGRTEKILDNLVIKKRQFDLVIADPPAFIPSPSYREKGYKAYYKLYTNTIKVVRPGGYLYASSCSYHLTQKELLEMLYEISSQQGYIPRIIYEVTPHNASPYTRPIDEELRYLKGYLLKLD